MTFEQEPQTLEQTEKPEKLPTEGEGGSLDGFLNEIRPVESAGAEMPAREDEVDKDLQQEKNRQAKKEIQPLIDKFKELSEKRRAETDYVRGQQEFAVLNGDKEEYRKLHDKDIDGWLAEADLYEQALKGYQEAGGEGDLEKEMYTGSTRERVLTFEKSAMGGADAMFEKSQDGLAGKYDEGAHYRLPSEVRATTPDDYISKLVSNAVTEAGRKDQWGNSLEMRKNNLRGYFWKKSQGFGIQALNHGDVLVAAKSFALAEAVGGIPADLQEQMRESYEKLDEEKKAEFATTLAREREEIKQKLEQALAQNQ